MKTTLTPRKPTSVSRFPLGNVLPRAWFGDLFDQFLTDENGDFSEMMKVSMDVAETDQAFEIKMDLPGVTAKDVDIQIDNNTLTVRGHRSEEKVEKNDKKQYHRIERYFGGFSRSVVLPMSVNEDETAAEFKDGVLKIVVPKSENAKPRKINIKT